MRAVAHTALRFALVCGTDERCMWTAEYDARLRAHCANSFDHYARRGQLRRGRRNADVPRGSHRHVGSYHIGIICNTGEIEEFNMYASRLKHCGDFKYAKREKYPLIEQKRRRRYNERDRRPQGHHLFFLIVVGRVVYCLLLATHSTFRLSSRQVWRNGVKVW